MVEDQSYETNPYYLTFDNIICNSDSMMETIRIAKKVANSNTPIALTGETGTGKEMFARAIHFTSIRKTFPFIPINCSALPDNLIESILFGYEDGAFTGAKKGGMIGQFEIANNGTIFLDEIGDMGFTLQAKLLRVLQTRMIQKIGSSVSIKVNFRLITATNKEMHTLVNEGKFRRDLLYRINTIPIRIPALKDRREDILPLVNFFLEKYINVNNNTIMGLSDAAKNILLNYEWDGNVREVENVIEYACNVCESQLIDIKDLPTRFRSSHRLNIQENINEYKTKPDEITPLNILEENEIRKAINMFGIKQNGLIKAADSLGISISTLYRKINKHNICEK